MKLSLCIIARNEEEMLPGCLASVKGIVDEIVVVDTGSTDKTVRVAERGGARVVRTTWVDDFSAARNLSIAHAHGEWILQLDADERLAPGAGEQIKKAIESGDFDCGLIRLHNASSANAGAKDVISGAARIGEAMSLPRLLRRRGNLRYEGIVHESVMRWIQERGTHVQFVDADIIHLGALPEIRRNKNKVSRNVELLKKRAANEPDDFTAYSYLAFEALAGGDVKEAAEAADAGWAIALRGHYAPGTSILRLAVARALAQKERGDCHGILETVRVAERIDGLHPDLCLLQGCAREMLARSARVGSKLHQSHLARALIAHRAALALSATNYIQRFLIGAGSWASLTRAATVLLELGQAATAREMLEAALALRPDDLETRLAFVEAEIGVGSFEAALARVEPMLGESPDAWILGALACDRLGATDDALQLLRRATQSSAKGYVSPHRKDMHLELMGLFGAYAGSPEAGPGPLGALTAIMARKPFDRASFGTWAVDGLPIESLVRNLLRAGRVELLDALLTPRAEAAFPGLSQSIQTALARLGVEVGSDDRPQPIIVCSSTVESAVHVERILSAHPNLRAGGLIEHETDTAHDGTTREVFWAWSVESAREIAQALPRATVVVVSCGGQGTKVESNAFMIELSYDALLDQPVIAIAEALAKLGETADDAPLRAVIESYPGRTRSFRAGPIEVRASRAARPSSIPARGALEVSP